MSASNGNWARVELFGHRIALGSVSEVERFGEKFVQIDTPFDEPKIVDGVEEFEMSTLYSPKALYSITSVTEEHVRAAHRPWRPTNTPALPPATAIAFPSDEDDSEEDPDSWDRPENALRATVTEGQAASTAAADDIPM